MRMTHRKSALVRATGLGLLILLASVALAGAQSNRALKILYAGPPGSDREKDFVQFLGQHFETVKTADLNAFAQTGFKEEDAEGFDVTILDYDGDGFNAPSLMVRPRFLDESAKDSRSTAGLWFTRPLITVSVAGGLMCSRWGLKTGYL